jgi:hypothetical protein
MNMSVTGFNRRREAQKAAEEAARAELAQQAQEAEALSAESVQTKTLDDMTYQELRMIAKDKGVEDYYKMNKDELREALWTEEGE